MAHEEEVLAISLKEAGGPVWTVERHGEGRNGSGQRWRILEAPAEVLPHASTLGRLLEAVYQAGLSSD